LAGDTLSEARTFEGGERRLAKKPWS